MSTKPIRHRVVLATTLLVGFSLVVIACAQTAAPPTPTTAAKPTAAPAAPAATQPAAAAKPAAPVATPAAAPEEIKIGVLQPLSGGSASTGLDDKYGSDLAAEICNNEYDFNMPLAKTKGLTKLGGAKVKLITVDHQGLPEKGQSEAERLITQEKVIALYGAYQSSVTQTASQAAERLGIPFVCGESSSPQLTGRGFKTFFRTSPIIDTYVENLFDMSADVSKAKNVPFKTVAAVYENTLYGTDFGKAVKRFGQERGIQVVADIAYPANTTEVSSEVQRLKAANPDVVMHASYLSDAILFMKTYKQLDFNPKAIASDDAGFTDVQFRKTLGKDAEYVITRAAWAPDACEKNPRCKPVMELFKNKFGQEMTELSARTFTGMLTLLDAINRAGSTKPEAIIQALKETNIPGDQLILTWKGVRFDETGQNIYAQAIDMQVFGGEYFTVWPFNVASKEIVWPRPKWSDIK